MLDEILVRVRRLKARWLAMLNEILVRVRRLTRRSRRYRRVFDSRDGQWVLNDILKESGVGREVFVPGGREGDRQTAHNAGARRVGLRLIYILTMTEADAIHLAKQETAYGEDEIEDAEAA